MASTVPDWNEYKRLVQLKAEPLFERAEGLKTRIKELETELSDVKTMLSAKMASAEAKSVVHNGFTFVYQEGGETRTLDKEWATKTLLQKGVAIKEIEKHTRVTVRKGGLRISSPKGEDD